MDTSPMKTGTGFEDSRYFINNTHDQSYQSMAPIHTQKHDTSQYLDQLDKTPQKMTYAVPYNEAQSRPLSN